VIEMASAGNAESIERLGFPLGFKLAQGRARSPLACGAAGRDVFKVQARQLAFQRRTAG
jgi:hypothetical protein